MSSDNNNSHNSQTNTFDTSNLFNLSSILKYYDTTKQKLIIFGQNFASDNTYVLYAKIFVVALLIMSFCTKLLTISMVSYVYFLNILLNTIKYFVQITNSSIELNNNDVKNIIKQWILFGSVMIMMTLLNVMSDFFNSVIVSFLCELLKCFTYYKIIYDNTVQDVMVTKLVNTYLNNKAGIETIQTFLIKYVTMILDTFETNNLNEIMSLAQELFNNATKLQKVKQQ